MWRSAAVVALLLAGCTATSDAPGPTPAGDELEEALGPEGDVSLRRTTTFLRTEGAGITSVQETSYFRSGALRVTVAFASVQSEDEARVDALQGIHMTLYCHPERLVLVTQGLHGLAGSDVDAQTPNRAGTCYPKGAQNEQMADAVARLTTGTDPVIQAVLGDLDLAVPRYAVVEGQQAAFVVQGGHSFWLSEATIEDGRIVSEQHNWSDGHTAKVEYVYGGRGPDPGLRGDVMV